jgi:hypothetical protein
MNRLRLLALGSAIALGAIGGCSGVPTGSALGNSEASIVQGLPIPQGATLVSGSAGTFSAHYEVPDAVSVNQLDQWYEHEIVTGRPWRDWVVCPSPMPTVPPGGEVWRWQKSGSVVRELTLRTSRSDGHIGVVIGVSGAVPPGFPCR